MKPKTLLQQLEVVAESQGTALFTIAGVSG